MSCNEIKKKVILTSNKFNIKYDNELVRKLYYRILEKRLLRLSHASDTDLIAAVTEASATEKERNLVQGKHQKKALCVYEISSISNK